MSNDTSGRAIICTLDAVRTRQSTQEVVLQLAVPKEYAPLVSGLLAKTGQQFGVAFSEVGEENIKRMQSVAVTGLTKAVRSRTRRTLSNLKDGAEF